METLLSVEEVKVKRLVPQWEQRDVGVALDNKPPQCLSDNKETQTLTLLICHLQRITPEVQTMNVNVKWNISTWT